MRFGIFLAPFHAPDENPTLAMRRDMELIEWLDNLGYDEAWIGEHHSAGFEIIASPELFIAAAAERTKRIKLGTGVSSLPYHHPLMLADRIMQLDHMTRGRVMFGMGPGSLPSDAFMMGIDPLKQRDMMDEAMGVLVKLMSGEIVTHKADWFELKNARLQLAPFTKPRVEMCAASTISPAGARAAGKYGLGLLSIGATSTGAFNALAANWKICEHKAKEQGQHVSRDAWRLVAPMHIAETREQAKEDVKFGLEKWLHYFTEVGALPLAPQGSFADAVEGITSSGLAVIGTPEDAIAQIERLDEQSGGFGAYLFTAHNWAPWERTKRSYELFARYVIPHVNKSNAARRASMQWAMDNRPEFMGSVSTALKTEYKKHMSEVEAHKAAKKTEKAQVEETAKSKS